MHNIVDVHLLAMFLLSHFELFSGLAELSVVLVY
jgi:hypothetical protein